jgi:hypothetical protein
MMTPGNAPQVSVQEATEAIVEKQEMRTKHTPGPWSVGTPRKMGSERHGYVWWEVPVQVGEGNPGNVLALVSLGGSGAISRSILDVQANARLIAAAPELLKALKSAKEFIENLQLPHEEWSITLDSLVAAIAKAEVSHVEPD